MKNYVTRRILQLIPVLLGISVLIFAVMKMIPGDVISGILGIEATPELRDDRKIQYVYFAGWVRQDSYSLYPSAVALSKIA